MSAIAAWFATSALGRALAQALAVLAAGALVVTHLDRRATRRERERQELQELRDERNTSERMRDADVGVGDPADDLEWLSARASQRSRHLPRN